ncbi:hypothetical protein LQZ19_08485 [Treponema primitia]|uniref:hypothetical protein n=1 Tax=Treponema primitia TaxID=88058 RepID=UPI0039816874
MDNKTESEKYAELNVFIDSAPVKPEKKEQFRAAVLEFVKVNGFPPYSDPAMTIRFQGLAATLL